MVTTKSKRRAAGLSDVDGEALLRAIALARQESSARRGQIDSILQERDWLQVATFCAYCCQDNVLGLKPWEFPPCWIDDLDQHVSPPDLGQRKRAIKLLRKMLALGLSRYEPDIINALERAELAQEAADAASNGATATLDSDAGASTPPTAS